MNNKYIILPFLIIAGLCFSQSSDANELLPAQQGKGWQAKAAFYREKGYGVLLPFISGEFRLPADSFVVVGTVEIQPEADVTIGSGAVLLCEPGSQIKVKGALRVLGSGLVPVVFRNLPHRHAYTVVDPADSLWDGVTIGKQGSAKFHNVHVVGSRYGIVAKGQCDSLQMDNVVFGGENRGFLSIMGTKVKTEPESSFNLDCNRYDFGIHTEAGKKKWIGIPTVSFGTATAISLTGLAVSAIVKNIYYNKAVGGTERSTVDRNGDIAQNAYTAMGVFGTVAGIAAVGGSISLVINIKKMKEAK